MKRPIILLSILMFLQFFTWGAWFVTLGQALGSNDLGEAVAAGYGSAPLGAIFAPLFLGLIADRFFPSQWVMAVLFAVGGVFLLLVPGAAAEGKTGLMGWLFLGNMLCYMPTLGLANTVTFSHLDRLQFPKARVWGTIGWIAAGLLIGFLGWSSSLGIFQVAGWSSILLGGYCLLLPHTPPPAKGEPLSWRALLMVDAWKLLTKPGFLTFIVCSGLICIPLAYYYGTASQFLTNSGFAQASATMSIGQMSEIIFMLLIPFCFRRLGVKWMIVVGMMAWVLRYLLFAFGAPDQAAWMLYGGIALHGICYDFFFVTGFMYTDKVAPKNIRSQAQALLVLVTQGLGMYFGYMVAFGRFDGVAESYGALDKAISAERAGDATSGAVGALGRMFQLKLPSGVDGDLLARTMDLWKSYWMFPALLAFGITIVFTLTFWDKVDVSSDDDS